MCPEKKLLLLLPAVFQTAIPPTCQDAFDDSCFNVGYFEPCCQCTTTTTTTTATRTSTITTSTITTSTVTNPPVVHSWKMSCAWELSMACCNPLHGKFLIESKECLQACKWLGGHPDSNFSFYKFKDTDYCPDGFLWQSALIKNCPTAHTSLEEAVTQSTQNSKWCDNYSKLNCTWSLTSPPCGAKTRVKVNYTGRFSYAGSNQHCIDSCKSLNNPGETTTVSLKEYCDQNSEYHKKLILCDPLKDNLDEICPSDCTTTSAATMTETSITLKGHGLKTEVVEVPVLVPPVNAIVASALKEECQYAFTVGECYDKEPFNACCHNCTNAAVHINCKVQFDNPPYSWHTHWSRSGTLKQEESCAMACVELERMSDCQLCNDTLMKSVCQNCEFAEWCHGDFEELRPKWCEDPGVCPTSSFAVRQPSHAFGKITAAVVGTLALVAFVVGAVAVRNHRCSREEVYRPLNDQSLLAASTREHGASRA